LRLEPLEARRLLSVDFGDAPAPYPTLAADDGARHTIVSGFYLGDAVDGEGDGLPEEAALGDDYDATADEDGVSFGVGLFRGQTALLTVTASQPGHLDAWIDFDHGGSWDPPEQVAVGVPLAAGENLLEVAVPDSAEIGDAMARFRFSSAGGLAPTGAAADGEVEDYRVAVRPAKDTVGLFDPTQSVFFLTSSFRAGDADETFAFGPAGRSWRAAAGDWNGDGVASVAVYDPRTSTFFLNDGHAPGVADAQFVFGEPVASWDAADALQPLAGDWDGDGVDTVGAYDHVASVFHLANTNGGGAADETFAYGPAGAGWLPVVGDWDGDGIDTVALFDPNASAFFVKNSHNGGEADLAFSYGPAGAGWMPLAGDWDGDGITSVGLYDPAASGFYLSDSLAPSVADVAFAFGAAAAGWLPLAGDWDGESFRGSSFFTLDMETPSTGSGLGSSPLVVSAGTITPTQVRVQDINSYGWTHYYNLNHNVLEGRGTSAQGTLDFSFPVDKITVSYQAGTGTLPRNLGFAAYAKGALTPFINEPNLGKQGTRTFVASNYSATDKIWRIVWTTNTSYSAVDNLYIYPSSTTLGQSPGSLMSDSLTVGARREPGAAEIDAVFGQL
jgi:hypothetical protein